MLFPDQPFTQEGSMGLKDFFKPVKTIPPEKARDIMSQYDHGSVTLLDVRQPKEYEQEHIPGAVLIPLPRLTDKLHELDTEKPTIVYCAIGGRSRVAAQMLAGKGFVDVYNLQGGIKAWNGHKATGPVELHFQFLRETDSPETLTMLAYHMEDAAQSFYTTLQQRTDDPELSALFKQLAGYEEKHKERVLGICREMALPQEERQKISAGFIEGGFRTDDVLEKNAAFLTNAADVLALAMMLETQSLDLYLRLADAVTRNSAREFLLTLADEEKKHLTHLGTLLEEKI